MPESFPILYLVRHGETEWSLAGKHTGLTDIPLTIRGEQNARQLGARLRGLSFAKVFTSPLQRAACTCALAGFESIAEPLSDLVEWDYGQYEGRLSSDIHVDHPDWIIFRNGCPGGESPAQVADRADRVIAKVRSITGNVLLFSSSHFLRVLVARWLGLSPQAGQYFYLSTASLSKLGYEHSLSEPIIRLWNDTHHLTTS